MKEAYTYPLQVLSNSAFPWEKRGRIVFVFGLGQQQNKKGCHERLNIRAKYLRVNRVFVKI